MIDTFLIYPQNLFFLTRRGRRDAEVFLLFTAENAEFAEVIIVLSPLTDVRDLEQSEKCRFLDFSPYKTGSK